MTLHALRAATSNQTSEQDYVPTHDEGVMYSERLAGTEYIQTGLDDDLDAAGWERVTIRDTGGTPVNFGSD